jgi:hypothetical protein
MAPDRGASTTTRLDGAAAVTVVGSVDPGPVAALTVRDSPFRGSGSRAKVRISITLTEPARLTVKVLDFDGKVRRPLLEGVQRSVGTWGVTWNGKDRKGRLVPDGPYRLRVTAIGSTGTQTTSAWVTKAPGQALPVAPRAFVVATAVVTPARGSVPWRRPTSTWTSRCASSGCSRLPVSPWS